jgi:hypothetical protein
MYVCLVKLTTPLLEVITGNKQSEKSAREKRLPANRS